jgi:hypothetical protein
MNRPTVIRASIAAAFMRTSGLVLALGLGWSPGPAGAQGGSTKGEEARAVEVSAADRAAASNVVSRGIHTSGTARVEGVRNVPRTFKANTQGNLVEVFPRSRSTTRTEAVGAASATVSAFTGPGFYPDDLSLYAPSGAVITSAKVYNVFVNSNGTDFGLPGIFLGHFLNSDFIHLLDQYTGSTQNGRYDFVGPLLTQYSIQGAQLNDATDIATIVHAVAASNGAGYNFIYNVFVPKGIDVCISTTTGPQCFSPNNPANWVFCAYHSSVFFSDIGNVYYTVIPYPDQALVSNGGQQYVCDVGQVDPTTNTAPTPNGVLVDSISSMLDHELSETITDPDGDAYLVQNSLVSYLSEIGDVCINPGYLYTPFAVAGQLYYVQPEYSNTYHACATVP